MSDTDVSGVGDVRLLFGWLLVLAGLGVMGWAALTPATFESSLGGEAYNLGLVYDHLLAMVGGGAAASIGAAMVSSVAPLRAATRALRTAGQAAIAPPTPRAEARPAEIDGEPTVGVCSVCGTPLTEKTRQRLKQRDYCSAHFTEAIS